MGSTIHTSTGSTDSTISTVELTEIIENLRADRHRNSTKKAYYSVWKNFNKFSIKLDIKPNSWEDRLILFVGHLVKQKRKSSTINSYVSAIRAVLMNDGIKLNENKYLLTSLTKACKLHNDQVRIKLPIQKGMLRIILKSTENFFMDKGQDYLAKMYLAIFTSAYYGMLRIGEMATGDHPILAKNVHIGKNKDKILFILRTSKTHTRASKPQIIKITALQPVSTLETAEKPWCPFKILGDYLSIRGGYCKEEEPFFVFADHSAITPAKVRNVLKIMLKRCNFFITAYSTHSFRAGRVNDLAYSGISVETLKRLGRWRSNAVFKYLT